MTEPTEEPKEFGQSITHLEDLKPKDLLAFFQQWNLGKNIQVTEKMDGFFLAFGVDTTGFFLQTKNATWRSPDEFPDVFFLEDMKRYFLLLQHTPLLDVVSSVVGQRGVSSVRVSGEAIPSHDHNIVMYDQNKIGQGVFVVYQLTVDNKQVTDPGTLSRLAVELNKHSVVKFLGNPTANLSAYKVPQKIIVNLATLLAKHDDVLSAPARTPEAKAIKQAVSDAVKQVGTTIKSKMLAIPYTPALGGDTEGYVVHLPNGQMVKLVDKDKFTASKKANWKYMSGLQTAEREFKVAVRRDPDQVASALDTWSHRVDDVEHDYNTTGQSTITIPKKHRETVENIKLVRRLIASMRRMLQSGKSPVDVVTSYQTRTLTESLVVEGGHALVGANSMVPRDALHSTIDAALKQLGISKGAVEYDVVGNATKPLLGDVDVALDINDIQRLWHLPSNPNEFWTALQDKLSTINVPSKVNKGFAQFHVLAPLTDKLGATMKAVGPDAVRDQGFVQVDFFLGNRAWMKDVLSGAPVDSKFKAIYRNLLLSAVIKHVPTKPNTRYTLDLKNGVQLVKTTAAPGKKESVLSREVVISSADELAKWLFGVTWTRVGSYESMLGAVEGPSFKYPELRSKVLQTFREYLADKKLSVPGNLQESLLTNLLYETSVAKIGYFAGAFKPPHRGHWLGITKAASECAHVVVFASTRDRDSGGFNLEGQKVVKLWTQFLVPVLPANVEVRFTSNPMGNMVDLLKAADVNPNDRNTYVIYGGEDDIPERRRILARVAPHLLTANRIEFGVVPRVTSGTKVRQDIEKKDLKAFAKELPPPVQSKAKEIYSLLVS